MTHQTCKMKVEKKKESRQRKSVTAEGKKNRI